MSLAENRGVTLVLSFDGLQSLSCLIRCTGDCAPIPFLSGLSQKWFNDEIQVKVRKAVSCQLPDAVDP